MRLRTVRRPTRTSPLKDPLVLFMPSGKRGRFPIGTPVLDAARSARRLCRERLRRARHLRALPDRGAGRQFRQARIISSNDHLSPLAPKEARYAAKRGDWPNGAASPARPRSRATSSSTCRRTWQINAQIVRKAPTTASSSAIRRSSSAMSRSTSPTCTSRSATSTGCMRALDEGLGLRRPRRSTSICCRRCRASCARATGTSRPPSTTTRDAGRVIIGAVAGPARTRPTASPATSARPPSPCIWSSLLSGPHRSPRPARPNPQIRFGEDLMSRVSYVMMNPDGARGA